MPERICRCRFSKEKHTQSSVIFFSYIVNHTLYVDTCFLANDTGAYELSAGLPESFTIKDCQVIDKHYTSQGMLIRIETTISMNQNAYNKMYRDYCDMVGYERAKNLVNKNKKSLKDFIK